MKCIKKNKNCRPILCAKAKDKDYICSGISTKPTKYKEDYIWLCLSGKLIKNIKIEMTKDEALIILTSLSLALSDNILSDIKPK